MPKLGLAIMSVIALAVAAASCDREEKDLFDTSDPRAETTALHTAVADAVPAGGLIRQAAARSPL